MSKSPLCTAYKALLSHNRLSADPGQAALVTRLASLQTSLTSKHAARGLYIYGGVGSGKSRIADLFSSTLPPSITHRRVHFYEFMMDIHSRLHHARSLSSYAGNPLLQIGIEIVGESRVLCFDEFQVTDIADASILKRLFGAIWKEGGTVVATSNRPPEGLYENGLNRDLFLPFIGQLRSNCEIWRMEGQSDYRITGGKQAGRVGVWFTEAEEFRESLMETTGGKELKETTIPVLMNRKLKVIAGVGKSGKLVVSSSFEVLCQDFLGAADYSALCKKADTIYLTGLHQFKEDELDYIRRFITLVDLAYESKTRIVCLANAPLFDIFSKIMPKTIPVEGELREALYRQMTVKGEGGSSSSMMSTFIGDMEWSATGLAEASLATGGAGETDVGFAVGRAVSRLFEMGSKNYGTQD